MRTAPGSQADERGGGPGDSQGAAGGDGSHTPTGPSPWFVLTIALAGLFTVSSTITLLVVSLGDIAKSLHTSESTMTWALAGPMLAFGVLGPAFGKAGDLWGHKKLFLFGIAGAGVFALLTGLSWNAASMITFRILSASLGAATGPAAMAMINRLFEHVDRVRALGYWSLTTAGAPVIGVVLGGPLVDAVGWKAIFLTQAPLCLLGFLLAWRFMPETDRVLGARFDLAGALLLALGVTSLLLATNRGSVWGWSSPAVIVCFLLSPALLAAFVAVERSVAAPLVPLQWLRRRNIVGPLASQALTNFAYMGGFVLTPLLLKNELGYTTRLVGLLVIARPLSFAITAPLGSRFTIRSGERMSGVLGALIVLASMAALALVPSHPGKGLILFGLALSGVGLGLASPALTSTMATAVDPEDLGVAAAMQQLMTQVGAVIGQQVMITVREATKVSSGARPSYANAYWVGAFACALGVAAATVVRNPGRP